VKALKSASDQGIVTEDQYRSSVQELAGARDSLAATDTEAKDLAGQRAALVAKEGQAAFDLDRQLREAEAELARLRVSFDVGGVVRSPCAGQVTEIIMDPGERVAPGLPIMRVEDASAPAVVYLFVPSMGRWLEPGKRVEVEPSGFPREEFGAMIGTIRAVSPTPQSPESVEEVVRNRLLSERLAGVGDTYKVEVVPEPDPRTYSHFRWTNGKGPPVHFGQGTLVNGRIKLRQRRPIQEVIPALKKWLGGT
jgi:HlyD family secretion protein